MIKPIPTCTKCLDRHAGCHAECDRYIQYTKDLKAYNDYWKTKRKVSIDADKFRHEGMITKMRRREGK